MADAVYPVPVQKTKETKMTQKIDKEDNRMRVRVTEIAECIELALMLQKPILFEGLSGIGKSEVIKTFVGQWLEKNPTWGGAFVQLQAMEFSDFSGIPVIKGDEFGKFVEFVQSKFTRITRPTVLIIDDITQASLDVQRVLLGLTQKDKVVGFTEISHPLVVIGTANDNALDSLAMVNEMQSSLGPTRWSGGRLVVTASKKDMTDYFAKKYSAENLFVRYLYSANCSIPEDMECSEDLKIRPVPRILEGCAEAVAAFAGKDTDKLRRVVSQIGGRAIAIEFYEFLLSLRVLDSKEFLKAASKDIKEFAKEKNAETVQILVSAIKGVQPLLMSASESEIENALGWIAKLEKAKHGECANILKTIFVEAQMTNNQKGTEAHLPFRTVMQKPEWFHITSGAVSAMMKNSK